MHRFTWTVEAAHDIGSIAFLVWRSSIRAYCTFGWQCHVFVGVGCISACACPVWSNNEQGNGYDDSIITCWLVAGFGATCMNCTWLWVPAVLVDLCEFVLLVCVYV